VLTALRRHLKSAVYRAVPRSRLVQRGPAGRRQVALTFDDGPDAMTRDYLDALDELHAKATFFVVGAACEREPELAREYVRRGHQIAGHGWDHTRFSKLSPRALRALLARTAAVLGGDGLGTARARATATARPWVRPPYGDVDARVLGQLLARGSLIALWSLDSLDYEIRDPARVAARCAPSLVSPGEVILLHEGQRWTLDALPRIVGDLRGAGYELVTMAEMFAS
jgi:peptidoglycan/xylan/chitin deacetylase (PgdA/CDA1 family)